MQGSTFNVHLPTWNSETNTTRFTYSLDDWSFAEAISLPDEPTTFARDESFDALLNLAAAILGTSYFKLKAPKKINLEFGLAPAGQRLIEDVYSNGLGEFYARNNLNIFDDLKVESQVIEPVRSKPHKHVASALLLIGGGKDSLASAQILDALDETFVPFAVNAKGPILSSFEKIERGSLAAKRTLDPHMIELSKSPENLNGHVPSTAMNSIIASLVAHQQGLDRIILSNERSASEGNRPFAGRMVNHQHSKSLTFEKLFSNALTETGAAIDYFSLLRPFSEARIAEIFSREAKFDAVFASCNRNFRQAGHVGDLWCCDCPKCRFVFLILAPHMPRARLVSIFGTDLLANEAAHDDFAELVGLTGHKPWECVGEIMEAAASVHQLMGADEWRNTPLLQKLHNQLIEKYGAETLEVSWNEAMNDNLDHIIPSELYRRVTQYANR